MQNNLLAAIPTLTPEPITPPGGFLSFNLASLISTGLQLLFFVAILLALIFILWAGISWITSGGDKEGLAKARARLTYAIIGLVVALLALFIMNFIGDFLGVKLFR